jgi:hypothetical protein
MANFSSENNLWDQAVGLRAIFYILPASEHGKEIFRFQRFIFIQRMMLKKYQIILEKRFHGFMR